MDNEDFRKLRNGIIQEMDITSKRFEKGASEAKRVSKVIDNTPRILDDLDKEFCEKTKLSPLDTAILFTAIGLQISRQYLLTKFTERIDDKTASQNTKGHIEEHSNRKHRKYNPSLDEIITNPVPFDANIGSNGALVGGGKMGHRVMAIGHDPVLGLIFGTANIATSTLTTASFESYHIYTNENRRDSFAGRANTILVLKKTGDKLVNQGMDGKLIVATSLMKEIIHLRSDLYSKNSLPLPFISVINPRTASWLATYGGDMSNFVTVGKQMAYSIFINSLIAMFHGLFFQGASVMDQKLYEVRTRKILSYSNLVASSSNLAIVGLTEDFQNLDLGGLAVTIYRLITDRKFIHEVKEEFIFGSYKDMIMGDYLNE